MSSIRISRRTDSLRSTVSIIMSHWAMGVKIRAALNRPHAMVESGTRAIRRASSAPCAASHAFVAV